jgi:hypothetical protein
MPQLDLGIYFFQIFLNLFSFWFLFFFIKFNILGKLATILKIKFLLVLNENNSHISIPIFYNAIELSLYRKAKRYNFHNFICLFNSYNFHNLEFKRVINFNKINLFLNSCMLKLNNVLKNLTIKFLIIN